MWDVVEETWLFEGIEQPIPARQLPPESLPEDVHLEAEDVHISWRGDSKFFATSSRAHERAIGELGTRLSESLLRPED